MRLTDYEKSARREVDAWLHKQSSPLMQAIDWVSKPMDWVVERVVPPEALDRASDAVGRFVSTMNDASEWTYEEGDVLEAARDTGLDVDRVEELRRAPLEKVDALAQRHFAQNTILAALGGGGAGLGGAVLIAADIPFLFTVNLRLIQQIAASYGFPLRRPEYRDLVLMIYNAAASGSPAARNDAMREISVAAAAFAHDGSYKARRPGSTFHDQSRNLPREIAKNLVGRKVGQTIPVVGAAIGAGVNYWFTSETAQCAYMLSRALFVEYKERS